MIAPRQILLFLYPIEISRDAHSQACGSSRKSRIPAISAVAGVETWFIKSLADAGSCHRHTPRKSSPHATFFTANRPGLAERRRKSHTVSFHRHQHTEDGAKEVTEKEDVDGGTFAFEEILPQPDLARQKINVDGWKVVTREEKWDGKRFATPRLDSEKHLYDGKVAIEEAYLRPDSTLKGLAVEDAEKGPREEEKGEGQVHTEEPLPRPDPTRQELLALVDQYDGLPYMDQLPIIHLLPRSEHIGGAFSAAPNESQDEDLEEENPPPDYTWPPDAETKNWLDELAIHLRTHPEADPQEIYEIYRALPEPRAPYLPPDLRGQLLHHLSVVERKNELSMLRYLSVIDDMKRNNIPLSVSEWTSAISFVASYVHRITETEVEAALQMWREMEKVSGVKANENTFNVLFDAACKAGKFVLAEMVYKEMEARGLPANRYHHVSLIFYYGLKKNANAVRAAYIRLVEAGEIVDTVVINAVISAFILASEPVAAEDVYEKMKRMHLGKEHANLHSRDWRKRRTVNISLKHLGRTNKNGRKSKYQSESIVAPDLQTFRILISYTAVQAGDLQSTARLLNEMKLFGLGLHHSMFHEVFRGFAVHGGVRYSEWDEARLESVWLSLLKALDDGAEGLELTKWLIYWVLWAFGKCAGKKRALAAWDEIREKWTHRSEEDLDYVLGCLRAVLNGPDFVARKQDWVLGM
ncbi:hypothetical protein WAI453_006288 [Rhynchosporium graminicola]|uniref:Pentatricopeptide repeat protein n=1 Tax=Rhynchosporium graminicola TaxID=2792576 RepID=A0A1E1L718_9HELO|nr:uncharacterized protein RCO7_03298 [Rhynchosporium commune]